MTLLEFIEAPPWEENGEMPKRRPSPFERAKREASAMAIRNESDHRCAEFRPHAPHVMVAYAMGDDVPCGGGTRIKGESPEETVTPSE